MVRVSVVSFVEVKTLVSVGNNHGALFAGKRVQPHQPFKFILQTKSFLVLLFTKQQWGQCLLISFNLDICYVFLKKLL